MTPTNIKGATRALGAPIDWNPATDGECGVLPIRDEKIGRVRVMLSEWQPTQAEIDQIVAGKPVVLSICGVNHPPVSLYVL